MNMNKKNLPGKIGRALDIPVNLIRGLPQLHVTGNREIFMEGQKSILQYDEDIIKVSAKGMEVSFLGKDLSLRSLNSENIVIEGQIQEIQFQET